MIDLELERTILGSMVLDSDCLANGMARIKKDLFTEPIHIATFELIRGMYEKNQEVDIVTVSQEGKPIFNNHGSTWLMIRESYVTPAAFDTLVDKLEKNYQSRRLHELAKQIVDCIHDRQEPDKIVELIESSIYSVSADSKIEVITPREHAERMLETLIDRMERKSNGGVKTRFGALNKALNGGFEAGQLIILAAQTGKGKTAFSMNLMRDIAIIQKQPALYINTEMSGDQMDVRWMTLLSQFDHHAIATGQITPDQKRNLICLLDHMNKSGFYSITEPDLTLNKLVSICRRFVARQKCKVIVVDYIGRMETLDPKLQEWQVLKTAAKRLKTVAQELQTCVIMLAQVNEDEKLEGARAMKNECDLYGYLRPLYKEELGQLAEFNYCLDIQKNRSGPTRKIPLKFYGERLTFKGEDDEL